jgi:hypothetical protein
MTEALMAQRDTKPDLASALWPHLSQAARAEQARQAQADAELKARLKRTANNLQEVLDSLRKEREQQSNK